MSTVLTANLLPEFERVAASLPGGEPVLAHRRRALARFAEKGFPTMREEAWKYTSTAALSRRTLTLTGNDAGFDRRRLDAIAGGQWPGADFVFVNGVYRADLSRPAVAAGLRVRTFAQALADDPTLAAMIAGFNDEGSTLVALNAAFAPDGLLLDLADDVEVSLPTRLLFVMTVANSAQMQSPRIVLRAGRRSRLQLLEHYFGEVGSEGFTNTVTQLFAAEGASINHVRLQDESLKATHIGNLLVEQAQGSLVASTSLSFGALMARQDITVRLAAPQAAVTLNGLYMAAGRQHVDHHTRVDHLQPDTRSEEYYKGILDGHGRGVFNGKVVVHQGAVKTDAQQSNKNLLLSKDAEIDTKPELEIYADDVKCAHGATVGQLDQNALFYLRSRGIDADAARGLLTYAFACDIVNRIGIESLQRDLATRIAGRLPVAADLAEML